MSASLSCTPIGIVRWLAGCWPNNFLAGLSCRLRTAGCLLSAVCLSFAYDDNDDDFERVQVCFDYEGHAEAAGAVGQIVIVAVAVAEQFAIKNWRVPPAVFPGIRLPWQMENDFELYCLVECDCRLVMAQPVFGSIELIA